MSVFAKGDKIPMKGGKDAVVTSDGVLGSGGQGEVYAVEYDGSDYALKWYTSERILERKGEFIKNMDENVRRGPPTSKFLWPLRMTEEHKGSFGYLMDLIPKNYSSLSDILRTYSIEIQPDGSAKRIKVGFTDLDSMMLASLDIVESFRALQRSGYSYQDLNDGGFYIDTKTGDVLICDCDNVAPEGINLGIRGKPGYMAPDVVTNDSLPGPDSDKYSLAVVLFKLFMRGDPLEGKKVCECVVLTGAKEMEFYGTNPIFIFNPNDRSNEPVPGIHNNVIKNWKLYPDYLKDAFVKTFTSGLRIPSRRVIPNEWFKILSKMHAQIAGCQCGFQGFADASNGFQCPRCGSKIHVLEVGGKSLALYKGRKLYHDQVIDPDSEKFSDVVGEVVENKLHPGLMGLKNFSGVTWTVTYDGQPPKEVLDGNGTTLTDNMTIQFGEKKNNLCKVLTGQVKP